MSDERFKPWNHHELDVLQEDAAKTGDATRDAEKRRAFFTNARLFATLHALTKRVTELEEQNAVLRDAVIELRKGESLPDEQSDESKELDRLVWQLEKDPLVTSARQTTRALVLLAKKVQGVK